jgi:PIN domain nuclease of toxin-antitoxin system
VNILVDTNIVLFLLFDDTQLSHKELELINDEKNRIIISSISIFEISLKYSIKKLTLTNITPDKIPDILIQNGYVIEDISYSSFASYYKLPVEHHKDPFDRILIWEAIRRDYYLMSKDKLFSEYEKYGLKLIAG